MKFRKKVTYVDAWQWFVHGDVPEVTHIPLKSKASDVQRRKLGWVDTPEGGHLVYPGDWVVIDHKGRLSTCNPISFAKLYESAEARILPMPGQQRSA